MMAATANAERRENFTPIHPEEIAPLLAGRVLVAHGSLDHSALFASCAAHKEIGRAHV